MPRSSIVAGVTPRLASRRLAAAPCGARELLAKPRGRDFVGLEQRLAVALALGILLAVLGFGDRHAGARGELPDGFGKRDLVVQLDELEDVAAGAAAEAVEEPLVAVDVERRRLLAVKRAEPLPRRAAAPQRDALLDDLHDVGVRLQVVDEAGRERAMASLTLLLELDDGDAAAALLGRGGLQNARRTCGRCRNSAMARRSWPVP